MLTAEEVRRLDRLALASADPASAAPAVGRRRIRVLGHGMEFQDYRPYQLGDDPRSIDWTVDARLRQLVVRLFRGEGQARLHVLMDVSGSMTMGAPSKLACARKLAAALCYVGVARRDAVGLATFSETIHARLAPTAGRPQLFRALEVLGASEAAGASAIDHALVTYGAVARGPGLVVVLSDFFESEPGFEGLRYLLYRGLTLAIVQVVASEETNPDISDEVELTDVEDPLAAPLVVDRTAAEAYRKRMSHLTGTLQAFCLDRGLPWLQVLSSTPFDELMAACVRAGVLRAYA